jgi:hypothetical protein
MDSLVQFGVGALGTVFCLGIVGAARGSSLVPALNTMVGVETPTESDRPTM